MSKREDVRQQESMKTGMKKNLWQGALCCLMMMAALGACENELSDTGAAKENPKSPVNPDTTPEDTSKDTPEKTSPNDTPAETTPAIAYVLYYVDADGSDTGGDGTETKPLKTVQKALTLISGAYTDDWPGKKAGTPDTAEIVVSGVVSGGSSSNDGDVYISGNYPPFELRGLSAEKPGTVKPAGDKRVIYIGSNRQLTLGEHITITGGNAREGGGVYVSKNASFIMNGGNIIGNTADWGGGGVYSSGIFIMNGGNISNNICPGGWGGGVFCKTFTMNDGNITGNTAGYSGGGVYIAHGTFNMEGGIIARNTASGMGGGVSVEADDDEPITFNQTGGTIYGYASSNANSNTVKSRTEIFSKKGHAVFLSSGASKWKDTTSTGTLKAMLDSGNWTTEGDWDYR